MLLHEVRIHCNSLFYNRKTDFFEAPKSGPAASSAGPGRQVECTMTKGNDMSANSESDLEDLHMNYTSTLRVRSDLLLYTQH